MASIQSSKSWLTPCTAVVIALLAALVFVACGSQSTVITTPTATPIPKPTATSMPTPVPTATPHALQQAALAAINRDGSPDNLNIPIPLAGAQLWVDPPTPDGAYYVHDVLGQNLSDFASPDNAAEAIESDAYDIERALYFDSSIRPSKLTIIVDEYSGKRVGQVTVDSTTALRWNWSVIWCAGTWYFASAADSAWLDSSLPEPQLGSDNWFLPPAFSPATPAN